MKSQDKIEMGLRLARLRKKRGITQRKLGELTGVSWRSYQAYEAGLREIPTSSLMALCDHFSWNPSWILTGSGRPYRDDSELVVRDTLLRLEEHLQQQDHVLSPAKKADLFLVMLRRAWEGIDLADRELEELIEMGKLSD